MTTPVGRNPFERNVKPSDDKYGLSPTPLAVALGILFGLLFLGIIVSVVRNIDEDTSTVVRDVTTSTTTTTATTSTDEAMKVWSDTTGGGGRAQLTAPAESLRVANSDSDFNELLGDCQELEGAVEHSRSVDPMPDERLQEKWDTYLQHLWAASTLCSEGIERPSSWLMSLAGDQIQAAVSAQIDLDNALAGT